MADRFSPERIPPLLTALAAACAQADRRSLTVAAMLRAPKASREALAAALVALGYPEALTSPRRLGASLRALRGKRGPCGGYVDRSPRGAGTIWYVVTGQGEAATGERPAA